MRQFQFDRGPAGPMTVEVHDDRVVLHHRGWWNRQREVSFRDLARIRFYKVSSPQRQHWGVALVGSSGKETMEYVRGRMGHAASGPVFMDAVEALVSQMLEKRPDLPARRGVDVVSRWVIWLAFAVPGLFGLGVGLLMLTANDALAVVLALVAFSFSAICGWFGWLARPWRSMPIQPLSDFVEGDDYRKIFSDLKPQTRAG